MSALCGSVQAVVPPLSGARNPLRSSGLHPPALQAKSAAGRVCAADE